MYKQRLTPEQAYQKIKHYCAYQERCHLEVQVKLYQFGLFKKDVDCLISRLIEENFLNEERFATQFAGGKFRLKKWGKIKIQYALQQKKVSAYSIKKALNAINQEEYLATLAQLLTQKYTQIKDTHPLTKQAKAIAYLQQKGYELNLIHQCLQHLKFNQS